MFRFFLNILYISNNRKRKIKKVKGELSYSLGFTANIFVLFQLAIVELLAPMEMA